MASAAWPPRLALLERFEGGAAEAARFEPTAELRAIEAEALRGAWSRRGRKQETPGNGFTLEFEPCELKHELKIDSARRRMPRTIGA